MTSVERVVLQELEPLIALLHQRGYKVVGPTLRDQAIVYDELLSAADLPAGWRDEQDAGRYRLGRSDDDALFGCTVGPQSWKRFLHPPALQLLGVRRKPDGYELSTGGAVAPRYAFLGVRPCELAAIAIQDRVLLGGAFRDPYYRACREQVLIVAVNCTRAGGTCFCASLGNGPAAGPGFDLALTELIAPGRHVFVLEAGSSRGTELASALPVRAATPEELSAAEAAVAEAARHMGRSLDTEGLAAALRRTLEHPRLQEVASRCLACGNCTMVCPTCFCTTVEDVSDLTGETAGRARRWDSCFSLEFSYVHGGSVRASGAARYRQWLTHKLANWQDQFGTPGCVGCGRCITWCPAAIDITTEARGLAEAVVAEGGAA
jgi:ferredoxin